MLHLPPILIQIQTPKPITKKSKYKPTTGAETPNPIHKCTLNPRYLKHTHITTTNSTIKQKANYTYITPTPVPNSTTKSNPQAYNPKA